MKPIRVFLVLLVLAVTATVGIWCMTLLAQMSRAENDVMVALAGVLVVLSALTLLAAVPWFIRKGGRGMVLWLRGIKNSIDADVKKTWQQTKKDLEPIKEGGNEMPGKKLVLVLLVGLSGFYIQGCGCQTIHPGYVGIVVNQWGANRGVSDYPIKTGLTWYNPITETVYTYPTFSQRVVYAASPNEGRAVDESVTFNSIEGATVNVDLAMMVGFIAEKVPNVFVEYRVPAEQLIDGQVRDRVRFHLNACASMMKVTDIFGEGKQKLLACAEDSVKKEMGGKGILVENISFISAFRVAPTVATSINAVIEQTQRAIEAENKVRQAKAEADQTIETARGVGESSRIQAEGQAKATVAQAEGDANATLVNAKAQAEANEIVNRSLTGNMISWQAVQKWNGVMPQVSGTVTPMIQFAPR